MDFGLGVNFEVVDNWKSTLGMLDKCLKADSVWTIYEGYEIITKLLIKHEQWRICDTESKNNYSVLGFYHLQINSYRNEVQYAAIIEF